MKTITRILSLVLMITCLAACAPAPTAMPTVTANPQPTVTAMPTVTPTPAAFIDKPNLVKDADGPYSNELIDRINSGAFQDQEAQLQAYLNAIGETGKFQYRYFEGEDGEVAIALQSTDSTGENVFFQPINPETGDFYTGKESSSKGLFETSVSMNIENQTNAGYSTDIAGTYLSVREGVGPTGLARVDEYGQIKAQLNQEGRWVSYAEAFDPATVSGPNGETWYVTETARMPESFGPAFEQAPWVFNGGRLAYSTALKRLAYIDARGNVTGLYNFKDSFIADENNYWVGQEAEQGAPIKAIGWGNVVFVYGNKPEYNQAVVVNKDETINDLGGEHIANTIRGYFALAYYVKNNNVPSGYLDSFDFFTRGEGSKLFDPNNPAVMDMDTQYYKQGRVNLSEPIVIASARKIKKDELYRTDPILSYGDGQFIMIEFDTYYENITTDELLSSYAIIVANRINHAFLPSFGDTNKYTSVTNQFGKKTFFFVDPSHFRRNNARIRSQKVK